MAGGEDGDGGVVWVPPAPGPLVRPGGAARDGLDDLLDELLPDTEEGPGATDAALIAGGGAVVAWAVVGSPPVAAAVAGAVALGLGCILPVRSLWRWAAGRRRPAGGLGVPLRADHHLLARLVGAYAALDAMAATTPEARGAAHGALLEVATLLGGRGRRRTPRLATSSPGPRGWSGWWQPWRGSKPGRLRARGRRPNSSSRPARSSTRWVAWAPWPASTT